MSQRPEGEDATSIERHRAAMKTELTKRNPEQSRIDRLMTLTFADRRDIIVKKKSTDGGDQSRFSSSS